MVGRSFGKPPKKLMRPPIAASWRALSCAAWAGAATMITSAPRPPDSGINHLRQVLLRGIDGAIRRQARGLSEAAWDHFADDHAAGSAQPGQLGVHDANRPGAHDQDHLSGLDPDRILPAQYAGKGLDQCLHR